MSMRIRFSPSIMCADIGNLRAEIQALEIAGADVFHMDIMDGEFVPNFALSWADFAAVRAMTEKPLDVHLMVKNPDIHLPYAFKYGADIIYVHFEVGETRKYLELIRNNGREAGLAINPETLISDIEPFFPWIDRLLIMRVSPGFSGAHSVPEVEEKIQAIIDKKPSFGIALDGSVSRNDINKWRRRGVKEFILGTSCGLFSKGDFPEYNKMILNLAQSLLD